MDIATVGGLIGGAVLIMIAIMLGGSLGMFIDAPSGLIVIGGSMMSLFIRYNIPRTIGMMTLVKKTVFHTEQDQSEIITQFVQLSQISRKEGLLALERVEFDDPFLAKGINYCVDGAETRQIEAILMKEIEYTKARHTAGVNMLRALNTSAPAFGMIGTLVGLVNMLANMDDPKSIGPAMAVAILTTLYGAVIANLIATPLADKLEDLSGAEIDVRLLMLEGILGLKRGENPRMLEETLHSFLSPTAREALKKASA